MEQITLTNYRTVEGVEIRGHYDDRRTIYGWRILADDQHGVTWAYKPGTRSWREYTGPTGDYDNGDYSEYALARAKVDFFKRNGDLTFTADEVMP